MKIFNLKAVADKILIPINNLIDNVINRIAINSKLYKALYNELKLNDNTYERLKDFREIIKNNQTAKLLTNLYKTISPSVMEKYDYQIIRLSEPNDVIVVSSDIEKQRVKDIMKTTSGSGKIFTIDEINKWFYELPINIGIYIFSSVWIKEETKLVNLLYKIDTDIERYKL